MSSLRAPLPCVLLLFLLNGSVSAQSIFQSPIPADQLAFLNQFAGAPARDLIRDKSFRKLTRTFIPDCVFHYGWDTPLSGAVEQVIKGSPLPLRIRDGRYLTVSGLSGPILAGRGFLWIDLQDGIALGGFYFHPTNGEPTPSVTVFSKQVKEGLPGSVNSLKRSPPTYSSGPANPESLHSPRATSSPAPTAKSCWSTTKIMAQWR